MSVAHWSINTNIPDPSTLPLRDYKVLPTTHDPEQARKECVQMTVDALCRGTFKYRPPKSMVSVLIIRRCEKGEGRRLVADTFSELILDCRMTYRPM
jgi:hypothetical protein